jgi:hypothetical protein
MKKIILLAVLSMAFLGSCTKYEVNKGMIEDRMIFSISYLQELKEIKNNSNSSQFTKLNLADEVFNNVENLVITQNTSWGEAVEFLIEYCEGQMEEWEKSNDKYKGLLTIEVAKAIHARYLNNKISLVFLEPKEVGTEKYIVTEVHTQLQFSVQFTDEGCVIEPVEHIMNKYLGI